MRRCFSFISSMLSYWLPLLGALLMLAFSFVWGSVSLGLCGAIVIIIASLTRLASQAARKNAHEGNDKI